MSLDWDFHSKVSGSGPRCLSAPSFISGFRFCIADEGFRVWGFGALEVLGAGAAWAGGEGQSFWAAGAGEYRNYIYIYIYIYI